MKKSELAMPVGGWVQVSLGKKIIGKFSQNSRISVWEGGGHDRTSRHVRTPLYRQRGVISGFEIVLHGVILPPLPLFARAGRIYWLE